MRILPGSLVRIENPLFNPFKQIFDLVFNLKPLEKIHVFLLKCLFAMVLFLIQNVVVDIPNLRMTVGKRPVAFLPTEPSFNPGVVVDEIG